MGEYGSAIWWMKTRTERSCFFAHKGGIRRRGVLPSPGAISRGTLALLMFCATKEIVCFASDVVDQLDLSAMNAVYEKEERGQPPYDSRPMTKLLVYGYCTGVFSSRRIQKRLREDIAFRVLAAGNEPDFRTLSEFRKIHIGTLQNLFEQILAMALECGRSNWRLKANTSKHKAMSYGRMKEKQQQLKEEVQQLLEQAEAADREKTASTAASAATSCQRSCNGARPDWLKIKAAKRIVERRARDKAAEEGNGAEEAKQTEPGEKDSYNSPTLSRAA